MCLSRHPIEGWLLGLQRAKLIKQRVVLRVGRRRLIENVVAVIELFDRLAQRTEPTFQRNKLSGVVA